METVTTKILDNSFISACITDIKSHNLVELCDKCYNLMTSHSVYEESIQLKGQLIDKQIIDEYYGMISILNMDYDQKYNDLLDYLQNRYPYLHKGELSTYLISLIHFTDEEKLYFITDDMQFRRKIPMIKNDKLFAKKFGREIQDINVSGTIGIIRRLFERDILTSEDLEQIIENLRNGSFYLTDNLIEYLRGS